MWAEGIIDRAAALNYVNDQILWTIKDLISREGAANVDVLDLGCGVGDSLQYLTRKLDQAIWSLGVTVSSRQARGAQQRTVKLGMQGQCVFLEADFQLLPIQAEMDVAFSVEAFAHATDADAFFGEVARVLKPGGRLVVCDDFQTDDSAEAGIEQANRRWLQMFKAGWHVPNLRSPDQVEQTAKKHGLQIIEHRDLTRYLHRRTYPNWLIPILKFVIERRHNLHVYLGSLIGGIALEQCIERGLVTYRLLVFEKTG